MTTRRPRPQRPPDTPALRFTPHAWAKLLCLCHTGETEVGGFGISDADDLLLISDFALVPQIATPVSVSFDDTAVADFVDQQIDLGRTPQQCLRIWIHTHPGRSALPSQLDEETFGRVFGGCDWAVMMILARQGETYARLRFNTGPGAELLLPVEIDCAVPFEGSDELAWLAEYDHCVDARPLAGTLDVAIEDPFADCAVLP